MRMETKISFLFRTTAAAEAAAAAVQERREVEEAKAAARDALNTIQGTGMAGLKLVDSLGLNTPQNKAYLSNWTAIILIYYAFMVAGYEVRIPIDDTRFIH